MSTRARETMRIYIQLDLSDSGTLWSEAELNRCIQRAVEDLSRFLPQELYYEETIDFDVTDEDWTSAGAAGTYVTLANKPIKEGSDTVKNAAGTAVVRDTGYTIDYSNGKITHISGGGIGNGEGCTITYKKSQIAIDLSDLSNFIRVERVEYPYGDVPQNFKNYEVYGDILYVMGEPGGEQESFAEKRHVVVRYSAMHDAPTDSAGGTFPNFLNITVEHLAGAYAMMLKGAEYEHMSVTDFASARSILGTVSNSNAEAALDNVDTYLAGAAAPSAAKYLGNGDAALVVDTYLSGASAPAASHYLTTGDDKIDLVNIGRSVGELYANFAQVSIQLAQGLLSQCRAHNEFAMTCARMAEGFIAEAAQRTGCNQILLGKIAAHMESATANLLLAEKFRQEGIQRRNEVWAIWRDPKQYVGQLTMVPSTDMGRY